MPLNPSAETDPPPKRSARRQARAAKNWTPAWVDSLFWCILGVIVLGTCAASILPWFGGKHYRDPASYPRLATTFRDMHISAARFLPLAPPVGALEQKLDASLHDFLQAEPYLFYAFRLEPEAAAAELARLRGLRPTSEQPSPTPPFRLHDIGLGFECQQAIRLEFGVRNSNPTGSAWHDPQTGWFAYEVSDD